MLATCALPGGRGLARVLKSLDSGARTSEGGLCLVLGGERVGGLIRWSSFSKLPSDVDDELADELLHDYMHGAPYWHYTEAHMPNS